MFLQWIATQVPRDKALIFYVKSVLIYGAILVIGNLLGATKNAAVTTSAAQGLLQIVIYGFASLAAAVLFVAGPTYLARQMWQNNLRAIVVMNGAVNLILAGFLVDGIAGQVRGFCLGALTAIVYLKNGGLIGAQGSVVKCAMFLMVGLLIEQIV